MRLMVLVFLAVLVSASPLAAGEYCKDMSNDGYCQDKTITYTVENKKINDLNISIRFNSLTTIALPEGMIPVEELKFGTDAFIEFQESKEGVYRLTLRPKLPENFRLTDKEVAGLKTNLPLVLPTKTTLNINIKLVRKTQQGVLYVVVEDPQWQKHQEEISRTEAYCTSVYERDWKKRVESQRETIQREMPIESAREKLKRYASTGMREVNRVDKLALWVFRMSLEGKHIYLWVRLENRWNSTYSLDKLELFAVNGGTKTPLKPAGVVWEGGADPQGLEFDRTLDGIAIFEISNESEMGESYTIVAHELGGLKRSVAVEGIEF